MKCLGWIFLFPFTNIVRSSCPYTVRTFACKCAYNWDTLLHRNIAPRTLTLLLIRHLSQSCHVQSSICAVIVGPNSQKSTLACILHNATGCSKTSWYSRHTTFDIHVLGHTSFSGMLNSREVWVLERSHKVTPQKKKSQKKTDGMWMNWPVIIWKLAHITIISVFKKSWDIQ